MIRRLIAAFLRRKAKHEATPRQTPFPVHLWPGDAILLDGEFVVSDGYHTFQNIEEARRYRDSQIGGAHQKGD